MSRRLSGLLLLLAALGVLRWFDPLREKEAEVVAAVPRAPVSTPLPTGATADAPAGEQDSLVRAAINASTGNAFKPRGAMPVVQPPPGPPQPSLQPRAVVAVHADELVAPPAPPPPPPLQVIGTWDDGSAPGVFVTGPNGTLLVRPGQTILDDYKVHKITKRELILTQLSTQREWPLSIPTVADTPPMYLKK